MRSITILMLAAGLGLAPAAQAKARKAPAHTVHAASAGHAHSAGDIAPSMAPVPMNGTVSVASSPRAAATLSFRAPGDGSSAVVSDWSGTKAPQKSGRRGAGY
jgi:hypothetical protein